MEGQRHNNPLKPRCFCRQRPKRDGTGADVTTSGRLFQRRLPVTGKTRSPTGMSRVGLISNDDDDDERTR